MRRAFRFAALPLAVAVAGLAGAAGAHAMPADVGAARIVPGQGGAPRSAQACPPTCTSDVGSGDQTLPGPPDPGTHDGPPGPGTHDGPPGGPVEPDTTVPPPPDPPDPPDDPDNESDPPHDGADQPLPLLRIDVEGHSSGPDADGVWRTTGDLPEGDTGCHEE